ncbi:YqaA family protein [Pseudomonas sp.]|uniref:YqaA family protein n=1 Tax=Pseudomonas sp. TaxID=306 RepID=UPI0027298012|nr:VTT domain-containing protein [Pseudomonas sp.]
MNSSQSGIFSPRMWLDRLDKSPHAMLLLFALSFMETLAVPIPIEVVLIPWMICHPRRKWLIAGTALAGNLSAAVLGYYLGVFAMDQWGEALVGFFGSQEAFDEFSSRIEEDGFMAIVAIGIVPIPFQIAMLAAGAAGYPVLLFGLAAIISRGARYFGLALLVQLFGRSAVKLWERHSKPVGLAGLGLLAVWVWFKLST